MVTLEHTEAYIYALCDPDTGDVRYVGNLQIEQRKPPTILRPNMRWLKDDDRS